MRNHLELSTPETALREARRRGVYQIFVAPDEVPGLMRKLPPHFYPFVEPLRIDGQTAVRLYSKVGEFEALADADWLIPDANLSGVWRDSNTGTVYELPLAHETLRLAEAFKRTLDVRLYKHPRYGLVAVVWVAELERREEEDVADFVEDLKGVRPTVFAQPWARQLGIT